MNVRVCVYILFLTLVAVTLVDGKKTYSSRRKSGNNRRGGSSSSSQPKPPPPQPSSTHHKTDTNTNFLNSERVGSSHGSGSVNMYHRQTPFNNKSPDVPKQSVPQTNGPIGFEKINSEVQRRPATPNVPSAPAYPAGSPPYPGRPAANAPNGPPPAYPGFSSPGSGFDHPPAYPGRPVNAPPVYSANNQPTNFGQRTPSQPGFGGYPNQQGGFAQQGSYPGQQNFGYSGSNFGQSYPGQQNFGYSNNGGNFGGYPTQGFGSHPVGGFGNAHTGGYGQPHSGFGGSPFGGSPFGQSHSFGGGQFGSGGYGGYGNSHYSPNNFGFSNNPGLFGSHSGYSGYNNMIGKHKRSRFGGLPIPIPIPIPIPLGGFGGFGGHSRNHRLLDSFVKNQNVTDNTTTSVFILNNSTVTPCTTDQFIYASLNVTVMSCTTGNCTAVKVFVTSNVTQNIPVRSAGLTMCLEPPVTYSSFADNVNPTVSDLHEYWMRVCKESVTVQQTENSTNQTTPIVTVKVSEVVLNETIVSKNSTELLIENVTTSFENATSTSPLQNYSENNSSVPVEFNATVVNKTETDNSECELFSCSWLEMCLPHIETMANCSSENCPPTKFTHQPCVIIKMCKSKTTPISTFATLNNTISRYGQNNNVTVFNDVANLTLISYMPPNAPSNCSQNATYPACQFPVSVPQEVCAPSNSSEATVGGAPTTPINSTLCVPSVLPQATGSSAFNATSVEAADSTTAPII